VHGQGPDHLQAPVRIAKIAFIAPIMVRAFGRHGGATAYRRLEQSGTVSARTRGQAARGARIRGEDIDNHHLTVRAAPATKPRAVTPPDIPCHRAARTPGVGPSRTRSEWEGNTYAAASVSRHVRASLMFIADTPNLAGQACGLRPTVAQPDPANCMDAMTTPFHNLRTGSEQITVPTRTVYERGRAFRAR